MLSQTRKNGKKWYKTGLSIAQNSPKNLALGAPENGLKTGLWEYKFRSFPTSFIAYGSNCLPQPIPRFLTRSKARLQPITQRHQFINLGDDAMLFAQGWKGD